jgi:hypothetical protein
VTATEAPAPATATTTGRATDQLTLFSVMWAAAAVAHMLGNTRYSPGWLILVVGAAALAVWIRPTRLWPLAVLAVAEIASVWAEAPILGNHWLLTGVVGVAYLLSLSWGPRDRDTIATRFLPAARLILLCFYGFAAFAKLNSGFLHPATSCGAEYLAESAQSLGLHQSWIGHGWTAWVGILGSVVIELTVFLLLLIRRTRVFGVLLGLCFHFVLALDRTHQFFDFSAVVFALFLLFLPPAFASTVVSTARREARRLGPTTTRVVVGLVALLTVGPLLYAAGPRRWPAPRLLREWGCDLWLVYGLVVIGVVVAWYASARHDAQASTPPPRQLRVHPALAIIPALVLFNGLTPYLELKTAYGWNMYGNLRTVDGRSNHLVVRRTLPLTNVQSDLITIVASDDPALEWYAINRYALPKLTLRAYASSHRDASLTFVEHGRTIAVAHLSDRPDLVRPVPLLQEKFQLFRAVDLDRWPRCQEYFGPLR